MLRYSYIDLPADEYSGAADSRLHDALQRAAEQAGYLGWWIAEDLAASVSLFLQLDYPEQIVESQELDEAVKSALRQLGYADVARHFVSQLTRKRVSLLHCVPSKPNCDFSRFLEKLAARIDALRAGGARSFHFHSLQGCAARLQTGNAATAGPQLRDIIVAFIRARLKTGDGAEAECQFLID